MYPNYLLVVDLEKKKVSNWSKCNKKLFGSLRTCQEPLWSFFSGHQTGRRSSHSRWRRCHCRHASWGKHRSRFLRGTSHCPWTPLRHRTRPAEERRAGEKQLESFKKGNWKKLKYCISLLSHNRVRFLVFSQIKWKLISKCCRNIKRQRSL